MSEVPLYSDIASYAHLTVLGHRHAPALVTHGDRMRVQGYLAYKETHPPRTLQ